ncbi:MAG: Y-family DNA polymerase [Methylocella sp.]
MRFLSISLPTLATDRVIRLMRARGLAKPPDAPLATIAKINGAQKLAALDARGWTLGLRPGMALPDARAMHPTLICADADPEAEAEALTHIADWCRRFTPLAALDAPDGVMLDVSGAAHLFGGEANLQSEVEARLRTQGFFARAALASTPEAAFALARYGGAACDARILPATLDAAALARRLGDLPLAALRIDPATLKVLAEAGLRRISDILMRPRAPIAARCGAALYARLDGLLGCSKTPISPRFEAPAFMAERRFLDGLVRREDIEASILSLAQDLSSLLARHGEGARRLEASLFRVDGAVMRFEAGASRPLREPGVIARLFRERFEAASIANDGEAFDAGYGFDVIRLAALEVERKDPDEADCFDIEQCQGAQANLAAADLADLVDRLGAHLGIRRVTRLVFNAAHTPEFAVTAAPAAQYAGESRHIQNSHHIKLAAPPAHPKAFDEEAGLLPTRPIRLLRRPEPIEAIAGVPDGPPLRFRWRRVLHEVAAFEGPERIAPEWRRGESALTRDYFRAEDTEGRRFWVFREGLFVSETTRPRWFMHGLFA